MNQKPVIDYKNFIEHEILISAPIHDVWNALINFSAWESWNPFIIKSEGHPIVGTKLKNTMRFNDEKVIFKPIVIKVESQRELVWKGKFLVSGIFDGTHGFKLESLGDGKVKFTNYEHFGGILASIFLKKKGKEITDRFKSMNEALKQKIENK